MGKAIYVGYRKPIPMKRFLSHISLILIATALASCGRPEASTRNVIQNKGSDTLVNVAQAWAEHYSKGDSGTMIAVSGGGSGTGISAMINGTVDIANASRKMKDKEVAAARKNGIDPIEHVVGFDALAVYVHKNNPVESLTLEQLARIYGEHGDVTHWSQIGVQMEGKADEIIRVSRQNNSGTYVYFKETVLGKKGEYKLGSLDMHGSKDVVDLCEKTPGAIGYSGLAYATDHVKLVPVVNQSGKAVLPSIESAVNGEYPIARPLFMYTAGQPQGSIKQYLDWILSSEGQQILHDKGYAPVNTAAL
jgi:phosphate transport system substrate-binding protein